MPREFRAPGLADVHASFRDVGRAGVDFIAARHLRRERTGNWEREFHTVIDAMGVVLEERCSTSSESNEKY